MTLILFIAIGLAILFALFWLLFAPRRSMQPSELESLEIEQLQVSHCRHFPQIAQLLRTNDVKFIQRKAPAELVRSWRKQRVRILRLYLNGLAQDFARMERLARLLAILSPTISQKQEWEWFKLGMEFRMRFAMVALRVLLGGLSHPELMRLTDFVVIRATTLELLMSQMAEVLPSRLQMSSNP